MISPNVHWVDIDADQWQHLWELLFGPQRQPTYVYLIHEGRQPAALVHSRRGQLDLQRWPADMDFAHAAAHMRVDTDADQAIVIDSNDVRSLWREQQRVYRSDDDLGTYLNRITALGDKVMAERAVCVPATLPDYPRVQYMALFEALHRRIGASGSFVLGVFEEDDLWFSLAGRLDDHQIVTLTTSQGLGKQASVLPAGPWRETYPWLLEACGERLGPPSAGVFLDATVARQLPFAVDPDTYLQQAALHGSAVLAPWPGFIAPYLSPPTER